MTMRTAGICLLTVAGIAMAFFERVVVSPAYTLRSDGTYGEMYGPVSFFRLPVDGILALCMLCACGMILTGLMRRRKV